MEDSMQLRPVVKKDDGTRCFKKNEIVAFLFHQCPGTTKELFAQCAFSVADKEEFLQLLGAPISNLVDHPDVSPFLSDLIRTMLTHGVDEAAAWEIMANEMFKLAMSIPPEKRRKILELIEKANNGKL